MGHRPLRTQHLDHDQVPDPTTGASGGHWRDDRVGDRRHGHLGCGVWEGGTTTHLTPDVARRGGPSYAAGRGASGPGVIRHAIELAASAVAFSVILLR